ncbi:MAG TPA: xanthine dehydrogenase family protein molybdopterin-binding subunit [Bryobacteraceae bacterium]
MTNLTRRSLLKSSVSAAAALVIGFDVPQEAAAQKPIRKKPMPNPIKAWLRINQDGIVTLIYSKSEMGQGVSTSLPMILADELCLPWDKVRVEHAPLDPAHAGQGTGGSSSVTSMWMPLRQAGAAARQMLIQAAAAHWQADPQSCTARGGSVWHNGKALTYGELVEAAAQLPVPDLATVPLKKTEEFELIGKPLPRKDIPAKVDGSAIYGLDVRVPGMVYAMVARCPVFGGKVKSFDASKAKALKGVNDAFVIDPAPQVHSWGGVAIIADSTYTAMQAKRLLQIDWDYGPHAAESSETLRRQFRRLVDSRMKVVINQGNADAVIGSAPQEKRIDCDYELPFEAHATMEPMNCTVYIGNGRAEAWAPAQGPEWVMGVIAQVSGLPPQKIQVHTTYLGGGFGRRFQADFAMEAAQIAKRAGRPVHLVWSREDDMTHDFYRPASYHRISGAVDDSGNILAWRHKSTSTSIAEWWNPKETPESSELGCAAQLPYLVKNYKVEYLPAASGVPRAWWRSVEASSIGFVMESFMDELAHAAAADPYEFRIRKLRGARKVMNAIDPKDRPLETARMQGVLRLAAEKGDWGKPLPGGHARGIACHYSFHSYTANVIDVAVENGSVRVKRVVSAVDVGTPVNPDGIRAQVEGAIVYGLTAAVKSQITIKNGSAVQSNFDRFATLSMKETPELVVHIVPSTVAPTGIGEPGLPPVAPALMNAIFAATGKRIRRLPLQPGDLA